MFNKSMRLFLIPISFFWANIAIASQLLPTQIADMPLFDSTSEALQRSQAYENEIKELKKQIKNCTDEIHCEQLTSLKSDYQYAQKKHIEKNGLPMFSVLLGPGYIPETGLMLAAGTLYSFSTDRTEPTLQRSNITLVAIANQTDDGPGFGVRSKQNVFFYENKLRYKGSLVLGQQSQYYWGIGNQAAKAQELSDEIVLDYRYVDYKSDLTFQLPYDINIGPAIHLKYFEPDQDSLPETALNDPNFQSYKDAPFTLGVGLTVQYDSRDVTVNAKQGQFINVEYLKYGNAIGGDSDYQKLVLDYRFYLPLRKNDTLAFYNAMQWSEGDVPYYDMPTLGGASSMRGLYTGHYRDNTTIENTVELRHTFVRANGELSVHGAVIWAGVGAVAPTLEKLYEHLLYSYGVGYRYEIQPHMNVRVDLGIGPSENGFYLTFTEAF